MTMKADIEEQLRRAIVEAEKAKITRYRLSLLTGVSQATLSLFVNKKRTITLENAAKLAAVLGLELTATRKAAKHGKRSV